MPLYVATLWKDTNVINPKNGRPVAVKIGTNRMCTHVSEMFIESDIDDDKEERHLKAGWKIELINHGDATQNATWFVNDSPEADGDHVYLTLEGRTVKSWHKIGKTGSSRA